MAKYTAIFTYSGMDEAELRERTQQPATVQRRLGPDEADSEVGPMFEITFTDGSIADAFRDELLCLHGDEDSSDCIIHISDQEQDQ